MANIRRNTEKRGIEISFPAKPHADVRSHVRGLGFRWSARQQLWYARFTPALWAIVSERYGDPIPEPHPRADEPREPFDADALDAHQPEPQPEPEPQPRRRLASWHVDNVAPAERPAYVAPSGPSTFNGEPIEPEPVAEASSEPEPEQGPSTPQRQPLSTDGLDF